MLTPMPYLGMPQVDQIKETLEPDQQLMYIGTDADGSMVIHAS